MIHGLAFKYPWLLLPRVLGLLALSVAIFAVHTCLRSSSVSFAAPTSFGTSENTVLKEGVRIGEVVSGAALKDLLWSSGLRMGE